MLLGAVNSNEISQLIVDGNTIARVSSFKLLALFIDNVLSLASCLHYLLPDRRDNDVIAKLRNASVYCLPLVQTERFKHSFIRYDVEHYK